MAAKRKKGKSPAQIAAAKKNLEKARAARSRKASGGTGSGAAKKGVSGAKKALKGTGALSADAEVALGGRGRGAGAGFMEYKRMVTGPKAGSSKKLHEVMRENSPLMRGARNLTGKKYAGMDVRWEKKTPAQKRAHRKIFGK